MHAHRMRRGVRWPVSQTRGKAFSALLRPRNTDSVAARQIVALLETSPGRRLRSVAHDQPLGELTLRSVNGGHRPRACPPRAEVGEEAREQAEGDELGAGQLAEHLEDHTVGRATRGPVADQQVYVRFEEGERHVGDEEEGLVAGRVGYRR